MAGLRLTMGEKEGAAAPKVVEEAVALRVRAKGEDGEARDRLEDAPVVNAQLQVWGGGTGEDDVGGEEAHPVVHARLCRQAPHCSIVAPFRRFSDTHPAGPPPPPSQG